MKESNKREDIHTLNESPLRFFHSAHHFINCTPHRVVANHSDPQIGKTSKVSTQVNQKVRKSNYLYASKIIRLEKKKKKNKTPFVFFFKPNCIGGGSSLSFAQKEIERPAARGSILGYL